MISSDRTTAFKLRLQGASRRAKNRWRPSFSETVSVINLIVLVAGGVTGYLLIERAKLNAEASKLAFDKARTQSDTIRTVADLSKILASVRPNVSLSIVANIYPDSLHNVIVKVENKGAHVIHIANTRIEYLKLQPGTAGEFETKVVKGIPGRRSQHADLQGIVPGGSRSFILGNIYFADRSLQGIEADVFLDAYTDPVVVTATATALSGVFPAEQLQAMSRQTFARPTILQRHTKHSPRYSIEWKDQ